MSNELHDLTCNGGQDDETAECTCLALDVSECVCHMAAYVQSRWDRMAREEG